MSLQKIWISALFPPPLIDILSINFEGGPLGQRKMTTFLGDLTEILDSYFVFSVLCGAGGFLCVSQSRIEWLHCFSEAFFLFWITGCVDGSLYLSCDEALLYGKHSLAAFLTLSHPAVSKRSFPLSKDGTRLLCLWFRCVFAALVATLLNVSTTTEGQLQFRCLFLIQSGTAGVDRLLNQNIPNKKRLTVYNSSCPLQLTDVLSPVPLLPHCFMSSLFSALFPSLCVLSVWFWVTPQCSFYICCS